MDDRPVEIARELLKKYGNSLLEDPDRLGQLLEDRCSSARKEIFLMSFALRAVLREGGVPSSGEFSANAEKTEAMLRDNLGFSKSDASWAAESIYKLIETCEEQEIADVRIEARKGFLQNIERVMAKRPRTLRVRKKALRNGLLLLFIIALFLWLFVRITESTYTVSNEHNVVFLAHLSGPDAALGHVRLKAAQLATDQRNAIGGVKGRPIRIRPYDIPIAPEKAAERVREVLSDRNEASPSVVISACIDDVNEAVAGIVDNYEIPLVLTESSRVDVTLTNRDVPKLFTFRLNGDNLDKGRVAAYFVTRGLKRKKTAIVSEAYDINSNEMKDGFREAMKEYAGTVVCEEVWTRRGGIDHASVDEINFTEADSVVLLNGNADAAAVIVSLREFGYGGPIIGMYFDDTMTQNRKAMDDTWWILPAHWDDPQLMSFQSAYRDKYNENISGADFSGAVLAYDSLMWTADALNRAPGFHGEALRHTFMSTRNLALTHATLSIDPSTHGPLNKAWTLLYCSSGSVRYQKRFRVQ